MKRFIGRLCALSVPILCVIIICEVAHRFADNDYRFKFDWLSNNAHRVQVLSFGSSHGYYGIDPNQFDLMAFNAAHVSQDLYYDSFIFDSFIDQMDSLKYVIIPVSYFSPWSNLEKSMEKGLSSYYCMYYHCPLHKYELKYHSEVFSFGLRPIKAIKRCLEGRVERDSTDLGMGTAYTFKNRSENWQETGVIAARRHSTDGIDLNRYKTNMSFVHSMIEKCAQKNVKVLLVTLPAYVSYRENLDSCRLSSVMEFCNRIAEGHENAEYYYLLSDDRFNEDDFYDADHLNEFGAQKLTKMINEIIMKEERLPSNHLPENYSLN